ncbi:sulfurtransferase complex subunit TusD [Marinomonas mediterranea]|jgi:sulfur relay protein TusD/DsrE|uniref:Sulfur relay protein TusD/DsrE n=1 Tax=Marinomonas mediterranea (strain ATCC 700492 / JCM 21426 / NBRC 103028 / MMB-1) TaxID=717774 RepID=F2JZ67_MARM1|nr:sulfurtransferase complex subunit TusD [Marinomonas mediterranea]ADZ92045.1 sulfur relay protein TusD/DsrE [Marinomonas mediterranea MMB-1]WCN10011.1 sulfurtransferase complex subunit TusD [Marinomonas mediterranea]WCN18117.1 sulfurtransferase complex subunit TusD [Marinomonas mediterranea MMB-1]
MKYALLVTGHPTQSKACQSALAFAQRIDAHHEHELLGVFFYEEGVAVANRLANPPRDEYNVLSEWEAFHKLSNTPLYVCIAAAIRRGVLNENESKRHELNAHNCSDHFQLEGLGTWVELNSLADKVVQFR